MIFAAGLGTRLRPVTDTMPKALVRVDSQPMLWHVLMKLKAAGMERIIINVHHFASQITDYLAANGCFGMDIRVSDESGKLLNTGGGIRKARPLFCPDSPVLIHNVDILSNADLEALYQHCEGNTLLLVSERETKRYLLFNDDMRLCGWRNTDTGQERVQVQSPCLKQLAFSGIHLLSPDMLPLMESWPDAFGIIDFYMEQCSTHSMKGWLQPDLRFLDIGKPDALKQAASFRQTLGGQ